MPLCSLWPFKVRSLWRVALFHSYLVVKLCVTFVWLSLAISTHNQQNPMLLNSQRRVQLTTPCSFFTPHILRGTRQSSVGLWEPLWIPRKWDCCIRTLKASFSLKWRLRSWIFFSTQLQTIGKCQSFPPNWGEWCDMEKVRIYQFILATFQCCVQS